MIAVLNKSTRFSSDDAKVAVQAVAYQVRYHAAPAWKKTNAPVVFYSTDTDVPPGAWPIVIFDNADQAGVLGWHSEGPDGKPFGRVFVGPVLDNGGSALHGPLTVASVLSHEVLEAYVDPTVNLSAQAPNGDTWALEVGDPVESNSYDVTVHDANGVAHIVSVSDFVTPAFFDDSPAKGSKFSHTGAATAPFKVAPGGYAVVNNQAVFGEKYPEWRRELKQAEFDAAGPMHADVPIGRSARFIDR